MSGLLGQAAPLATTLVDLYTVPANTEATLRVIVSNRGGVVTNFRVAASKNGDPIANEHYIVFDKPIAENDTGSTIAFVVAAGDIIRAFAGNANLSFTATGNTRSV